MGYAQGTQKFSSWILNHFDIKIPISFGVNVFLTTLWNEMISFASDANIINKTCKNVKVKNQYNHFIIYLVIDASDHPYAKKDWGFHEACEVLARRRIGLACYFDFCFLYVFY